MLRESMLFGTGRRKFDSQLFLPGLAVFALRINLLTFQHWMKAATKYV